MKWNVPKKNNKSPSHIHTQTSATHTPTAKSPSEKKPPSFQSANRQQDTNTSTLKTTQNLIISEPTILSNIY